MNRKAVIGLLAVVIVVAIWGWRGLRSDGPAAKEDRARSAATTAKRPAPPVPHRTVRWGAADPEGPLRLEGLVLGPDGKSIGGAEVWLDASPPRTALTDASGRFSFDKLLGRTYVLSAASSDATAGPVRHKLTEGQEPIVLRLAAAAAVVVTVTDESKQPIRDAEVKVSPSERTLRTSDQGTVKIAPVRPGFVTVEVSAVGYGPLSVITATGAIGTVAELAITLREGYPVSGRIVDEERTPIAGVQVTAWHGADELRTTQAMTNDQGEFTITALSSGSYTLRAFDGEHAPGQSPAVTVAGAPVQDLEIVMTAGGVIAGTVHDAAHKPVPFATVGALDEAPRGAKPVPRQTTTDSSGAFELRGLDRRRLVVQAESEAAASAPVQVDLIQQPRVELALELANTAAIAGQVIDAQGAPLAGWQVNALPASSGGPGASGSGANKLSAALTGQDGRFTIHGLADGSFRLWALRRAGDLGSFHPAGQPSTPAKAGDKDVRITVVPDGKLVGKVAVAGAEAPPKQVRVTLGSQRPTLASEDGGFVIEELPPGTYDVIFRSPDFADFIKPKITIAPGRVTDLGTVTAVRGRVLTGRIIDASGAPVGGAQIKLGRLSMVPQASAGQATGFDALFPIRSAESDADGGFTIAGVPRAPMIIMAYEPAHGTSLAVDVPGGPQLPGDPPPVTLTLRSTQP